MEAFMSDALPAVMDPPSVMLAKKVHGALGAAKACPRFPDDFVDRLASGKVSAEDWRRMAEQSIEVETGPSQENHDA